MLMAASQLTTKYILLAMAILLPVLSPSSIIIVDNIYSFKLEHHFFLRFPVDIMKIGTFTKAAKHE